MAAYTREGLDEVSDDKELSPGGQSRRALLGALAVGGALAAAKGARAQSGSGTPSENQLRLRLLRRVTYGPNEADVKLVKKIGFDAYVDQQLNFEAIDDSACENAVAWYSTVFFSERDLFKVHEHVAKAELSEATMVRAILSKRQLYQRMVEFWTDHFNVYYDKVGVLKVVHDRDVIRKHALGNFRDMLMANTKSPATIVYLDNEPSTKEFPNQNLARELMELHAIGVNGGYTQEDVLQVAKCLTGWTVRFWPDYAPDLGKFYFDKWTHAGGTKVVLGNVIPIKGGIADGELVCKILSSKRNGGRYLGKKLWKFFLGYEPTVAQVEALADIFMNTKGEIKPMVKAILSQENLAAAPLVVKRPFHFTMGLLRQTQAAVTNTHILREILYQQGQHPFEWAPPNGYPQSSPYWAAGLLPRWNFAFRLFAKEIEHVTVNRALLMKDAVLLEPVLTRINQIFYQGEMNSATKAMIREQLVSDTAAFGKSMTACGLACSLPGYQLC